MNLESAASAYRADLFRDCRVLVVGGTSGIGLGIAAAFARHGADVCATGATDAEVAAARADAPSALQFRRLDRCPAPISNVRLYTIGFKGTF